MLYGSQEPTFRHSTPYSETHGDKCVEWMRIAGKRPLEWQAGVLGDWLAMSGDRYANSSCGLNVPRQNGKTLCVCGRIGFGMQAFGEWVVYTSHLQKTSTETFEELAAMFESPRLSKYVKAIKTALGREEIILRNGGRCKFLARTRNGGRGQHGDLWVCDESQELSDEQQGSFLPLLAASRNPQTIYTGTPPDENASGEVFARIRQSARDGKQGICFAEWSVDEVGDTSDETRWARVNPSLGHLIGVDTIRGEQSQMSAYRFARERLSWWPLGEVVQHAISASAWEACAVDAPVTDGARAYGVKFSTDGSKAAVCVAVAENGSQAFVDAVKVFDMSRGMTELAEWCELRADDYAVYADGKSGALDLCERVPGVMLVKPADMVAACSGLKSAVDGGEVGHCGQAPLADSITKSRKRRIGSDGGWGFDATRDASPELAEACAIALWGAKRSLLDDDFEIG